LRSQHHAGRLVTVERAADRCTLIWLAMLDANEFAQRHDLPELARSMLATGLRLGEALGITWADIDLTAGSVAVRRTIIRVQGKGLVAKRVKPRASERRLPAVVVRGTAQTAPRATGRLRRSGLP
jgi:site-specific recombinase XerC